MGRIAAKAGHGDLPCDRQGSTKLSAPISAANILCAGYRSIVTGSAYGTPSATPRTPLRLSRLFHPPDDGARVLDLLSRVVRSVPPSRLGTVSVRAEATPKGEHSATIYCRWDDAEEEVGALAIEVDSSTEAEVLRDRIRELLALVVGWDLAAIAKARAAEDEEDAAEWDSTLIRAVVSTPAWEP